MTSPHAVMWACFLLAAACGKVTPAADAGGLVDGARGDTAAELAPATAEQACEDLNTGLCNAIETCSKFLLQLLYGDVTTCVTRGSLSCRMEQAAPGVTRTPGDLQACGRALATAACADLVAGKLPAACQEKPGTVPNGAGCGANAQCQSAYCRPNGECGVCAARQPGAGTCSGNDACQPGLVCATSLCVAPGEASAPCDMARPCRDNLYCRAGVCAAKVPAGATCDASDQACDTAQGAGCNPFNKICQTVGVARTGEPCGLVNGTLVLCGAAGTCQGGSLLAPGACAAAADDGAPCGPMAEGKECLGPARCVGGLCRLPASASCR